MITLCKKIAASPTFESVIIALILLSAVVVGLETDPVLLSRYGRWLVGANQLILGVFLLEVLIKITAHAPRVGDYFRSGWNLFDFTVVALSFVPAAGQLAMVARLVRILRVLRLISAMPKLRLIVSTLVRCIPSLGHVLILLSLLFYIYGVLGYHLYAQHDPQHFGSLGASLLTLFQIVTLEGWADIMRSALVLGNWHWLYFISFVLLGTFIVINLFVAIVIDSLEESHRELAHEAALREAGTTGEIHSVRALLEQIETHLQRLERRQTR
jgi:voltage-gated sodium channel